MTPQSHAIQTTTLIDARVEVAAQPVFEEEGVEVQQQPLAHRARREYNYEEKHRGGPYEKEKDREDGR